MLAFDSNEQKVKFTGLKYNFKNGVVEKNNDIGSDEFNYSVSGSTLTIKALGNGEDLIATINSDGSIRKTSGSVSVMKEFKGNLYAVAEAEVDSKRILAKVQVIIVDGASCTTELHNFKTNRTPQEKTEVEKGTASGNTLTLNSDNGTISGSLSDEKIVFVFEDLNDTLTLKRM